MNEVFWFFFSKKNKRFFFEKRSKNFQSLSPVLAVRSFRMGQGEMQGMERRTLLGAAAAIGVFTDHQLRLIELREIIMQEGSKDFDFMCTECTSPHMQMHKLRLAPVVGFF